MKLKTFRFPVKTMAAVSDLLFVMMFIMCFVARFCEVLIGQMPLKLKVQTRLEAILNLFNLSKLKLK